jgi:hypothetical protein
MPSQSPKVTRIRILARQTPELFEKRLAKYDEGIVMYEVNAEGYLAEILR